MAKKGISIVTALHKYDLTEEQVQAVETIKNNKIVVLRGVAGVSKSFCAVYAAMHLLAERKLARIAVTRPMVATEKMGFLPGDIGEKVDPFLYPIIEFFNKFGDSGNKTFESLITGDKVRRAPIAFLRGSTIEDEILIADEMQNSTPAQMLMLLTRLGRDGKIVITGDEDQSDLPGEDNGLSRVVSLAGRVPFIKVVTLTQNMREGIIKEIIENWDG